MGYCISIVFSLIVIRIMQTRKTRRNRQVCEKKSEPGSDRLAKQSIEFIEKGKILVEHAHHHWEEMVCGDCKIKNFTICSGRYGGLTQYLDDLRIKHTDELQLSLIKWIRVENAMGSLFNSEYWKPYRDPYEIMYMLYVGYRRMFVFKQYYFQFAIRHTCECNDGEYDDITWCSHDMSVCFGLAYYGWKDDACDKLMPNKLFAITPDNMMSDYWWNHKQI